MSKYYHFGTARETRKVFIYIFLSVVKSFMSSILVRFFHTREKTHISMISARMRVKSLKSFPWILVIFSGPRKLRWWWCECVMCELKGAFVHGREKKKLLKLHKLWVWHHHDEPLCDERFGFRSFVCTNHKTAKACDLSHDKTNSKFQVFHHRMNNCRLLIMKQNKKQPTNNWLSF